jgi:hypothetical protein
MYSWPLSVPGELVKTSLIDMEIPPLAKADPARTAEAIKEDELPRSRRERREDSCDTGVPRRMIREELEGGVPDLWRRRRIGQCKFPF